METLIDGFNGFSFDLFKQVFYNRTDASENTVISSFSVLLAMFMALAGANKDTKLELIHSLKLETFLAKSASNDLASFHETIQKLIEIIGAQDNNDSNKLILANKIILNNQKVLDSYKNIIDTNFKASIDVISTDESFKQVIAQTNEWISELTNKKIDKILDDDFKSASLALINAIYFNYEWLHTFESNRTLKESFYLDSSRNNFIQVEMMRLNGKSFPYLYSDALKAQILSLPYKNERFSFNVVLPNEENDFLLKDDQTSLINRLDFNLIKPELSKLAILPVNIRVPKFVIKNKMQLNSILKELGMQKSFDSRLADFSGISGSNNLYINEVQHYSFIEINEKGTEAAAATVVKISKRSATFVNEVVLNRPFVYFITEKSTGLILFSGSFNGGKGETRSDDLKQDRTEL